MNELAIAVPTSSAKTRIIIAYANEPNYVKHYEPRRRVLTYANDQLYGHCVTQWTWKTYNNIGHRHARWMTRRRHLFRKNMRMSGAPNLNARHYFIYRTVMFGPHRALHTLFTIFCRTLLSCLRCIDGLVFAFSFTSHPIIIRFV